MTSILTRLSETRVNSTTLNSQNTPNVLSLSDGSYVVFWEGDGVGSDSYGIYAQHYNATGHRLGGETQISTALVPDQHGAKATLLEDGGFVVTWYASDEDGSSYGIYAQRYDANFVAVGSETLINTTTAGAQIAPNITGLADGGYAITWQSADASGNGIFTQKFDANGTKSSGQTQVNTTTSGEQTGAAMAQLSGGAYVIVWTSSSQDSPDNSSGIYMQRFSSGFASGAETRVNSTTAGDQRDAAVATLADGGFIVTWASDGQDGDGSGIIAQRYDFFGAKVGGEVIVNSNTVGDQVKPSITGLSDGGWVIAWQDNDQDGFDLVGICAQRYDPEGTAIGDQITVNDMSLGGYQTAPSVSALANGGFVITYNDDTNDGSGGGIFQRVFSDATNLIGTQTLYGTADSDTLDGGSGADIMYGGNGDDIYYVNSVQDSAIEQVGQGDDTIITSVSLNILAYQIENLTMAGSAGLTGYGNELDNTIIGNVGANNIFAGDGNDTVHGGAGNDNLSGEGGDDSLYGEAGNDVIDGGAGENYIDGGVGNDTINGGGDADTIYGGDGNDFVDSGAGDDTVDGGAGTDILIGGDGNDTIDGGTGNDTINGGAGDDILVGGTGGDTINGGVGNDYIYGGDQNDHIYASIGTDYVYGDAGTDTYDASSMGGAATIDLNRGKAVQDGNVAWLNGIENVIGSAANDTIIGSAGDNVIDGGLGADKMSGGLGNDTYYVDDMGDKVAESSDITSGGDDTVIASVSFILGNYIENLTLGDLFDINGTGNSLDNIITGNSGNNILDGKAGNDTLIGGFGDDTYVVDATGDTVVELAGQGTDTVKAAISYTLGDNLENLILTGTANINGTGNTGNNTITGNAGNNIIDGGTGADIMTGGLGDDTYFVDNVGDVVNDYSGAGNDTIMASVSYTLTGRYVETLQLTGSGNINAIGNSQDNKFISNSGNNSLTGGTGADTFVFLLNSHADIITDFKATENDTIDVSAYHAVAHTVTQSGTSVIIDFGGGNTVTVLKTTVTDVTAHTLF